MLIYTYISLSISVLNTMSSLKPLIPTQHYGFILAFWLSIFVTPFSKSEKMASITPASIIDLFEQHMWM